MLETVSEVTYQYDGATQTLVTEHKATLELEFTRYFPEISSQTYRLLRDPFTAPVTSIPDDNDAAQTELLGLRGDSSANMKFDTETLTVFWSTVAGTYPNSCDLVFCHLLPFPSTYPNLCDLVFCHLLPFPSTYPNLCDPVFCHLLPFPSTYPNLCDLVFCHLLPFPSTYPNLCDLVFCHLLPFPSAYPNLCDLVFCHLLPFPSTYPNLCDLVFCHLLPFPSTYPNLCDLVFRHLLPFASTYRCEAAFSDLLHSKTKFRNRLQMELRYVLAVAKPRINMLCSITHLIELIKTYISLPNVCKI